jgi:hypothetical protein
LALALIGETQPGIAGLDHPLREDVHGRVRMRTAEKLI